VRHAAKSKAADREQRLASLNQRISMVEAFVRAKQLVTSSPQQALALCDNLLAQMPHDGADAEPSIRMGDVYALMVEYWCALPPPPRWVWSGQLTGSSQHRQQPTRHCPALTVIALAMLCGGCCRPEQAHSAAAAQWWQAMHVWAICSARRSSARSACQHSNPALSYVVPAPIAGEPQGTGQHCVACRCSGPRH
jgi:hypothetical protein